MQPFSLGLRNVSGRPQQPLSVIPVAREGSRATVRREAAAGSRATPNGTKVAGVCRRHGIGTATFRIVTAMPEERPDLAGAWADGIRAASLGRRRREHRTARRLASLPARQSQGEPPGLGLAGGAHADLAGRDEALHRERIVGELSLLGLQQSRRRPQPADHPGGRPLCAGRQAQGLAAARRAGTQRPRAHPRGGGAHDAVAEQDARSRAARR